MKTYKLLIENFLTIEKMEIDLSGVKGFVGENAQGKTNILKAINEILTGSHDALKIQDGKTRAMIRIDELQDGEIKTSISKVMTQNGARIEANGLPYGYTPKTYIEKLFDQVAINPLQLIGNNVVSYLKEHLPVKLEQSDFEGFNLPENVDFSKNAFFELDRLAKYVETVRREKGKELKHEQEIISELQKQVDNSLTDLTETKIISMHEKIKLATYEIFEIKKDQVTKNAAIVENKKKEKQILEKIAQGEKWKKTSTDNINEYQKEIERLQAAIIKAQESVEKMDYLKKEETEKLEALRNEMNQNLPVPDFTINQKESELTVQKLELEKAEKAFALNKQIVERKEKLGKLEGEHLKLDETYKHMALKLPKMLVERSKLPVEGVTFVDGELFVSGRRIDLLSETERMIVAAKIGIALAKQKGHIAMCLDGLELADAAHRKIILDEAEKSGLCVLYTRCGSPEYPHETEIKKA